MMPAEDQPATARVRAIIAFEIDRLGPIGYGADWWELLPEEEVVFQISRDDMPGLVIVWQAYEEFNDATHEVGIAPSLIEQMKAEHPWMVGMKDRYQDESDFVKFAKLFDVSYRKASAWYQKNKSWAVRCGITRFNDEPEPEMLPDPPY